MKDCLIVINHNAGKCRRCTPENVKYALGKQGENFRYSTMHLPSNQPVNLNKYHAFAVCGGDGTLQIIMQKIYNFDKTVYYFPCGTLNDKAGAEKYCHALSSPRQITIGKARDNLFTYVYATGAFTEIGYTASQKSKRQLGVLAYAIKVLKAYKVNRIECRIETNGKTYQGEFNLVMFIKSPRCFGFNFNKLYDERDLGGHMVLIRSPKHNGLVGMIEMFFPFFKVFFVGLNKEQDRGTITFKPVTNATLHLKKPTDFCVDGEKRTEHGQVDISFEKTMCKLQIIDVKKSNK